MKNKDVQVVVFDTRPLNSYLSKWLERFKHVQFTSKICPGSFNSLDLVPCKRNQAIKWFLEETKLKWLLMLDDDIIPLDDLANCPKTWPLIKSEKDVVSARFISKMGNEAHGRGGDVAMAAVKISRTLLKKIKPPYTHFAFNADETERMVCECDYFAAKCRDAGFYPTKAGAVGHIVQAAVVPSPLIEKDAMCKISLFGQLKYKAKK